MSSLFSRVSRLTLGLTLVALHGCTPEEAPLEPRADAESVSAHIIRFGKDNAAVYWNGVARDLVVQKLASTPFAIRAYAIVSVAQYQAAVAAEKGRERGVQPSVHAAISAASVVTLSYLFPTEESALETLLEDFLSRSKWPRERNGDTQAGDAVGRIIGAQMVARAQTDNFFAQWAGTVPVGPGVWFSSTDPPTPPAGAAFGHAKTFMLGPSGRFRPPPPPAFGSPAFTSAVAEVRSVSDGRTAEQDSIAKFWHLPVGTYAPPGYWNDEASKLAVRYRLGDRHAAHVLALMNIVSYDALVASHEAKYTYWVLRPSQADPGIQLSVPLPNFPSYPSNHAAISAGSAKVLGHMFPAERRRLNARAEDASWSRVLGGIHYGFDGEAGLTLGRKVADWAIKQDAKRHRSLVLR